MHAVPNTARWEPMAARIPWHQHPGGFHRRCTTCLVFLVDFTGAASREFFLFFSRQPARRIPMRQSVPSKTEVDGATLPWPIGPIEAKVGRAYRGT